MVYFDLQNVHLPNGSERFNTISVNRRKTTGKLVEWTVNSSDGSISCLNLVVADLGRLLFDVKSHEMICNRSGIES